MTGDCFKLYTLCPDCLFDFRHIVFFAIVHFCRKQIINRSKYFHFYLKNASTEDYFANVSIYIPADPKRINWIQEYFGIVLSSLACTAELYRENTMYIKK